MFLSLYRLLFEKFCVISLYRLHFEQNFALFLYIGVFQVFLFLCRLLFEQKFSLSSQPSHSFVEFIWDVIFELYKSEKQVCLIGVTPCKPSSLPTYAIIPPLVYVSDIRGRTVGPLAAVVSVDSLSSHPRNKVRARLATARDARVVFLGKIK